MMTSCEDRDEKWHRCQLSLLGAVLTGYSEKMLAHAAVLEELAGRLRSLVEEAGSRLGEDRERFAVSLASIERHARLLREKNRLFQSFGHHLGRSATSFEPGEIIAATVALAARNARLHGVSLEAGELAAGPPLEGDPARLHFLLLLLLKEMLPQVGVGGAVSMRAAAVGQERVIEIEGVGGGEGSTASAAGCRALGDELARELGVTLERTGGEGGRRLITIRRIRAL